MPSIDRCLNAILALCDSTCYQPLRYCSQSRLGQRRGPPIELELVTERGLQITAPEEWLQLLAGIGIEHVQIRGGGEGDEPQGHQPRQRRDRQLPGRRRPHDREAFGSPAAHSPADRAR